jgi:thiol-disulfide isomerase/thioredoxin
MPSFRSGAWVLLASSVFVGGALASFGLRPAAEGAHPGLTTAAQASASGSVSRSVSRSVPAGGAPCATGEACRAHAPSGRAPAMGAPGARPSPGRPQMIVFSSQSCPACARMAPVVDAAARACGGERDVVHVDFDDDAGEALAATYAVSLLPSFVSVDADGLEVARLTGVHPQEHLEQAIEEIRGVRCAALDAPERAAKAM